jgi:hypothetical protein
LGSVRQLGLFFRYSWHSKNAFRIAKNAIPVEDSTG